ncbi:ArsB/NhaD family transporter [Thermoflavimicrobium daqui]|uniref:ArsB/NhaD family transporter n=1 Tax=Thermoflavimicrobium daqui TaxID=2137476 RepID=UPI000DE54BB3|nr:ArsB/NhaD family transporter [Thermoflavimicrobium daqui]
MLSTILAILIFIVIYTFIITEKFNRAILALIGASSMVIIGIIDIEKAFTHYIEWETITLLIGMMILVGITNKTGIFQYLAVKTAKISKGNPIRILISLSLLTAVASAFLDNVTTVLLIVPVTLSITKMLEVNPIPFLISEILASNIGGTATLIGDPPNIMIGSENKHLTFNAFLFNLAPIVIVILVITLFLLYLIYRRKLRVEEHKMQRVMELDEKEYIQDAVLLKKSLFILAFTIVGFILHSIIHIEASVIAITGATLLMLFGLKSEEVDDAFQSVEWVTIFFFAGLFTLVGGLQEVGVIKYLASQLLDITNGNIPFAAILILWGSGIASAFIDNIPFVATMIPLINDMAAHLGLSIDSPQINALWWSLALGACLGGNGTIIGASANVVVADLAAKNGQSLGYIEYLKIAAPLTLLALLISHIYVYLRYLIYL